MAKRQIIQKKKKAVRITRNERYLVNYTRMGDEPTLEGRVPDIELVRALNWYNCMCTTDDARGFLENYLQEQQRLDDLKTLKRLPDTWVPLTSAWLARMFDSGVDFDDKTLLSLENKLERSLQRAERPVVEQTESSTPRLTIQQKMREKGRELLAEIDDMLDTGEQFSLYEWLQKKQVPTPYCAMIVEKYAPQLDELYEAAEGKDPDLKEAYRNYTKKTLAARVQLFEDMLEDAEKFGSNAKKVRAPRKKRAVSVDKILKSFKYQKDDPSNKLASVKPEKILGAAEVWLFNTKYKTLTVLRALDRGGLQIKGTTITGADESNSCTKRAGRKQDETLKIVLDGGKVALKKVMDGLGAEAPLALRTSETTIILRVVS